MDALPPSPPAIECVIEAAQLQQIQPLILLSVMLTEGGWSGAERKNKNGSYDLGAMQINDRVWIAKIANLHFDGNQQRARAFVRDHGCYNVHVGSWILRAAIDEANGDVLEGVGFYHSHTPHFKKIYQRKFLETLKGVASKLFGKK